MMLRLASMEAVVAHLDDRIEHPADFRRRDPGAPIAQMREEARQAGIAGNPMGIGRFLEALEGGEDEARFPGLERLRENRAENDVGRDMRHLDVDIDWALPRCRLEAGDRSVDRI